MHVFIVIPAPEKAQMIPRTYDTLAVLGQQGGMTKQEEMIDEANKRDERERAASKAYSFRGVTGMQSTRQGLPDVVSAANRIDKPSHLILENLYGLKVCVAMLNACEFNHARRQWRYREIYIHSKLLLVDDGFFTLGSANLNQRSMVADSEINLATNDVRHATDLRKRIWSQLATEKNNGGDATLEEIKQTFKDWVTLMNENKTRQKSLSTFPEKKQMKGLIVPLDDGRTSTIRLA